MFVDLDWPLNASSLLSASAELLVCLCFNCHISRWTSVSRYQNVSILNFVGAKCEWGGGDNWSYKTCKAPVKLLPSTNQHPTFYRPYALPVAQPTVSEHWRELFIDLVARSKTVDWVFESVVDRRWRLMVVACRYVACRYGSEVIAQVRSCVSHQVCATRGREVSTAELGQALLAVQGCLSISSGLCACVYVSLRPFVVCRC